MSCDFVPHNYETLKWLSSLPTLMQESFWWWQCSDRYNSLLLPHFHKPSLTHFSLSLISRTVSVDVKHHAYLLTHSRQRPLFPQCPCSSRSSVSSSCCLCIWFRGEPTLFHVGANKSYVIATSTVPEEWDPPSWAGWPTSWFLWTADFAHLTSARCPKRGQGLHQQLREVHCGAMF